ncbi:MAG: amidase [Pirellulaceae bacterium]|nr:amidase [Pirellulaceae bacterium]
MSTKTSDNPTPRRNILKALTAAGIGSVVFQKALAARAAEVGTVTAEMVHQAEWIAGLDLNDEDRETAARSVAQSLEQFTALREISLNYETPPALHFSVRESDTNQEITIIRNAQPMESAAAERPDNDALAFLPITELAALLRTRQISSVELTKLYLDRLHRYNEQLKCVVTFTDALALRQAERADQEIGKGQYRGTLHGIPWGAKDLIAYPGYPTTWGAPQFQERQFKTKATVAQRLDDAGAVLVAKLSLGALAWGDKWFGGMTRNPWNIAEGSSGSSAGSASATAAGLVGFSLGSETLGSIVSPCRRCGITGLRPTFGRVSRYGCMPLAWSMDKIGPICRSVEDCALVLDAIHGRDGMDKTVVNRSFHWPPRRNIRQLRVGYIPDDRPLELRSELNMLQSMGCQLVPIALPTDLPNWAMTLILNTEAASVFDDLIRHNDLEGLNRWPGALYQGTFTPAVEYLRANRLRTLLMEQMEHLMESIDVYVEGNDLGITNLTGHPSVVIPNGFSEQDEVVKPKTVKFTGRLFGESDLLAVAHSYQQATTFHLRHPKLEELAATPSES